MDGVISWVRRSPSISLLLASFASLYFELLYIRWIPSVIHVVGFFSNLVLIASFMGLGIGVARGANSKNPERKSVYGVLCLTLILCLFLFVRIKATVPIQEHDLNEFYEARAPHLLLSLTLLLPSVYAAVLVAFVPLGELVGKYLQAFRPIKAYSLNIFGSLIGVLAFTGLSCLSLPPMVWLAVGGLILVLLSNRPMLYGALIAGTVILVAFSYRLEEERSAWKNVWTPYYDLKVFHIPSGFAALVNNFFLLTGAPVTTDPAYTLRELYQIPYAYIHPKRVLILGAGGGNDVSEALAQSADRVDAVEIDPGIIGLGRKYNVEKPYQNPKVRVFIADARTYLKNCQSTYDLIIFGTLDSHGLFSALSSIKMENFVYTQQAFEDARRLLSPSGMISLTLAFDQLWVSLRLYGVMRRVFGGPPVVYSGLATFVTILAGPAVAGKPLVNLQTMKHVPTEALSAAMAAIPESRVIPTDDWPQLFLRHHQLPNEYLIVGAVIVLLSTVAVLISFGRSFSLSPHFFFMGTGFLLLEAKSITELALTFGSTWITNAVVISSVLAVILLANLLVLRLKLMRYALWYCLLMSALLATWIVPHEWLITSRLLMQIVVSGLFTGVPVFLASVIFAISMSRLKQNQINRALSANLIGCVVGGMAEYATLIYGFRSLCLLAIIMYFLSLMAMRQELSVPATARVPETLK